MQKFLLLSLCFFPVLLMQAQVIDFTSTSKNVNSNHYFRFHYDNDFFGGTDYYYTQGIKLEYVNPSLQNRVIDALLLHPFSSNVKYGFMLDVFGYTPTNIRENQILYGDRPYAACILISSFICTTDTLHHQQLTSTLSVGIIGPWALGREVQTLIHRTIGKAIPQGWQHQIKNDLVLNYQLDYEKKITQWKDKFLLNGISQLRLGTLNTRISAGLSAMLGKFTNPFKNELSIHRVNYYLYAQSQVTAIGYNAFLQGGLFHHTNDYTIANKELSRIIFQNTIGAAVGFKKLVFTYARTGISREFDTGKKHQWGGISVAVLL